MLQTDPSMQRNYYSVRSTESKEFFKDQPETHIRHAVDVLQLSYRTTWLIIRKQLKWKASKPHLNDSTYMRQERENGRTRRKSELIVDINKDASSSTSSKHKCSNPKTWKIQSYSSNCQLGV